MPDRDIIIGDVHGELDHLESLLEAVRGRYVRETLRFVFVGDLVDRGPDSAGVVGKVRRECTESAAICVLGNHDELFLQAIALHRRDLLSAAGVADEQTEPLVREYRFAPMLVLQHWIGQGGAETIRSYGGRPWHPETWDIPPEDVRFLATLPLAWGREGLVVSHARAGAAAIEAGTRNAATPWLVAPEHRHELLWNRSTPVDPPRAFHVSGHTPRETPFHRSPTDDAGGGIEIDTGCVFGNLLTAYDPVDDLVLQVRCG